MEAKSYARALLAHCLMLAPLACGFVIEANDVDLYYRVVQEEEMLEWSTFWAFAVAAGVFPAVALGLRRHGLMPAWFAPWPWRCSVPSSPSRRSPGASG